MQTPAVERQRRFVIGAALLALFLGALDALVMSAAMPTITAELGGMELYSWVYSAYFLARAVTLPVIGKLADLASSRLLFLGSILIFLIASAGAGSASSMAVLVGFRVVQGMGAGGIFALVYIILSDISARNQRGKTLSLASSVWGIASIVGPTLGGIIVTYFSWRWIFYLSVPVGLGSLLTIAVFLKESPPRKKNGQLDLGGLVSLTLFILAFLTIFIVGGSDVPWLSRQMFFLLAVTTGLGLLFYRFESKAAEPVLDFRFFRQHNFAWGSLAAFFASFTVFALFAYGPLYLQGALGLSPFIVGMAMLALSLGWSCGSLVIGRFVDRGGGRGAVVGGGVVLVVSSLMMNFFTPQTSFATCFLVFLAVGFGIGFVSLSTLLLVQESAGTADLGVATSFHQFARTLGGTVGVGICGGLVTAQVVAGLGEAHGISPQLAQMLRQSVENIFKPEFQAMLDPPSRDSIFLAVAVAMAAVFRIVLVTSCCCLVCGILLRGEAKKTV